MQRKIKALGLVALAMLAIGAIGASGARAEVDGIFTADEYPATIDGGQVGQLVFTRQGRTYTCEIVEYHGGLLEEDTDLTLEAIYEECHSVILGSKLPATITMNGCDYVLHATVDVIEHENGEKTDTYTAVTDLECPEGKLMEVHVYSNHTNHTAGTPICTYTIPEQTGLQTVDLTNIDGEPDEVLAHIQKGGITTAAHGSPLLCGVAHDESGTIEGSATFSGTNQFEEVGLTVSTDEAE